MPRGCLPSIRILDYIAMIEKTSAKIAQVSFLPLVITARLSLMSGEREDIDHMSNGVFAPVLSFLSAVLTFIKILIEEGFMGAPIFSILKLLVSYVDPAMAIWIVVIMTAGYWLKRMSLPEWVPPLPVLLLAMYLAVGFVFGWLQYEVESWSGLVRVLLYGIGNGIIYTGFSFIIYDIAHGAFKKAKAKAGRKEAA